MATSGAAPETEPPDDPEIQEITSLTSDLVAKGLMAPEHQQKLIQLATAATAKIDELRGLLESSFSGGLAVFDTSRSKKPARQQVIDSVSSTVLNINRIQSTFSLLTDAGQDAAQKIISFILDRLMAVLADFKKHLQYQNWSISFTGGIPPSLQVGVQITFQ
jgi:hypothetical protein